MQIQSSSVKSYYTNVLHSTRRATRGHERDETEQMDELRAEAERARAHKKEKEEETGEPEEDQLEPTDAYERAKAQTMRNTTGERRPKDTDEVLEQLRRE